MNNENLKQLYRHLIDGAFMTMETNPYYCMTLPFWLSHCRITCEDDTVVQVNMIEDIATSNDERDIYLWVEYSNRILEYPLYCAFTNSENWFIMMRNAEERVIEVLHKIANGGKEYLTTQIKENGILCITSLAITEKRMKDVLKLPCSCAISVNGQVFNGVDEVEMYTQTQSNDSSPYILKRCHPLPMEGIDDEFYGQRFARNYLLCKDKDEAEYFMKTFIGIKDVSTLVPDGFPIPVDFPPLIYYVDRSRYLLLSYRGGENE